MISYYDLMILVKNNKQPYKILVSVDEDKKLLFEYNEKYNTYYMVPTSVSTSYCQQYDKYLDLNMYEETFFEKNIEVVDPYQFSIGEYVSYFDLLTSIKFNMEPYKIRLHIEGQCHDYIFDSLDGTRKKMYIELSDDGTLPSWEFYLSHQISDRNWFEKNIEIIEAGNSLIRIIEGTASSSYFSIFAVKIKDKNKNVEDDENIEKGWDECISIEETDFEKFLFPLIERYFEANLLENKNRYDNDDKFEWYLTNNYYTYDTMNEMLLELKEIISLLTDDYNNPKLEFIKKGYDWVLYLDPRIDSRNIRKNGENLEVIKYKNEIINFYKRFIYYMEKIMKESEKEGFNLISFMGP